MQPTLDRFAALATIIGAAGCGSSAEEAEGCRAIWSRGFDGGNDEIAAVVAVTPDDGILLAGYASGLDFGSATLEVGDGTAFVAKLDADGEHVWSKYLAIPSWVPRMLLATDSDANVLVAGDFEEALDFGGGTMTSAGSTDGFLVKLDPQGDYLWSRQLAGPDYHLACAVVADSAGNAIVAGTFEGAIDLGGELLQSAGGEDIYVAKLDPEGRHLWSKRFGDATAQRCSSLAVDPAGGVLMTGAFLGTLDLGGVPLESDGDAFGGRDAFVAKLDANGGHIFSHRIASESTEGNAVAADAAGNVVLAGGVGRGVELLGNTISSADEGAAFVAKLDAQGSYLWGAVIEGTGDSVTSVAVSASSVFITGTLLNASIAALGPDGSALWSGGFLVPSGEGSYALAQSIAADASGNAVVAGEFDPALDFGCGPLAAQGGGDIFVAKLRP